MKPYIDIPVMQVRPNCLLVYPERQWLITTSRKKKKSNIEQVKAARTYSGKTTRLNVKRMKRVINILVAQAKPKEVINPSNGKPFKFLVNFVTLTLPCAQGSRNDRDIKTKCLDPWIKSARRMFKLGSYFWRAERQGNGNIHFHFITDVWIPYDKLRDSWNQRLEHLGMITEFEKAHGHRHPNSTDVHSVNKISNLASYLVKYMTKDFITEKDMQLITGMKFRTGSRAHQRASKRLAQILNLSDTPINGKIWDCSQNLKKKGYYSTVLEDYAEKQWNKALQLDTVRVNHTDRFSSIYFSRHEFLKFLKGSLKAGYNDWLETMRYKAA